MWWCLICFLLVGMFDVFYYLGEVSVLFVNFNVEVDVLLYVWFFCVLECFGGGNFKVLCMDGMLYFDEVYEYVEGLLVIDGELCLCIDGDVVMVFCGELYVVFVGVLYSVDFGSVGMLVILDV